MWAALIDYWHYTNDTSHNNITTQGLLSQIGPLHDFMMPGQEFDEGNDDQAFWGFAAMSAVEHNYPSPGTDWLPLVEALWNTQVRRWDLITCAGGLKWQIFNQNAGYDYKNAVSNGAFFQLSARLARYTGNDTYTTWASKSYNWSESISLVNPRTYDVYDGSDDKLNCSELDHTLRSYNLGIYLYGAAVMYNYTNGSSLWETRTTGLIRASATFFTPFPNATNIMYETTCEKDSSCNLDAQSFKAYLSRFMWATTQMAPYTTNTILNLLRPSAMGAAASCSGGSQGTTCGSRWYTNAYDGLTGAGQQMAALEVMQGLLINGTAPPGTDPVVHLSAPSTTPSVPAVTGTTTTTGAATESPKKSEGIKDGHYHDYRNLLGLCISLVIGASFV